MDKSVCNNQQENKVKLNISIVKKKRANHKYIAKEDEYILQTQ